MFFFVIQSILLTLFLIFVRLSTIILNVLINNYFLSSSGDTVMSSAPETLLIATLTTDRNTARAAPAPPLRSPAGKHLVHWFRKGLRLHDNPAFREGLKTAVTFRCIFIIDPWFASSSNVGINKWR